MIRTLEPLVTTDPAALERWWNPLCPGIVVKGDRESFHVSIEGARYPRVGLFESVIRGVRIHNPGRHPYTTVSLMLEGEATVDTIEGEMTIGPGVIHVENYGSPFTITIGERPIRALVLVFEELFLQEGIRRIKRVAHDRSIYFPVLMDLQSLDGKALLSYARFVQERMGAKRPEGEPNYTTAALEELLLSALLDLSGSVTDAPSVRLRSPLPGYVRRAENYIVEHLSESLTLENISRAAGVSTRSLTREFRRLFGTSVMAFVRDRRLSRAREDLSNPEEDKETVVAIALRYGFSNPGRFAAAYRRAFGEYPAETRRDRFA